MRVKYPVPEFPTSPIEGEEYVRQAPGKWVAAGLPRWKNIRDRQFLVLSREAPHERGGHVFQRNLKRAFLVPRLARVREQTEESLLGVAVHFADSGPGLSPPFSKPPTPNKTHEIPTQVEPVPPPYAQKKRPTTTCQPFESCVSISPRPT